MVKCAVTFGMFFCLPYIWYALLKHKVTRQFYAAFTSLSLGVVFFILSILFVPKNSIIIGTILFVSFLAVGYPTQYFMYPRLHGRSYK